MTGQYVPSWVALRTLHGLMDRDGVQYSFREPHGDIHELLLMCVLPRRRQFMLHSHYVWALYHHVCFCYLYTSECVDDPWRVPLGWRTRLGRLDLCLLHGMSSE